MPDAVGNGKRNGGKRKPGNQPDPLRDEKFRAVCAAMSEGLAVTAACEHVGVLWNTFRDWVLLATPDLAALYARAREARADRKFEELEQEARKAVGMPSEGVQAQRLIVDTLKFMVSKMAPQKYGDRQQVEVTGKDGGPVAYRLENLSDGDLALFEQLARRAQTTAS